MGEKYSKILKKIFGRKTVHVVGSLKIELSPYTKSKNIIKPFETRNISKNKKIITVFTSLNDYKSFVKILNDQNLSNYVVLLKPHPLKISKTFDYFRKHLKHEFIIPKKIEKNLLTLVILLFLEILRLVWRLQLKTRMYLEFFIGILFQLLTEIKKYPLLLIRKNLLL